MPQRAGIPKSPSNRVVDDDTGRTLLPVTVLNCEMRMDCDGQKRDNGSPSGGPFLYARRRGVSVCAGKRFWATLGVRKGVIRATGDWIKEGDHDGDDPRLFRFRLTVLLFGGGSAERSRERKRRSG